jgi:predicted  nucleic acid-binding Zn-ribbon protein
MSFEESYLSEVEKRLKQNLQNCERKFSKAMESNHKKVKQMQDNIVHLENMFNIEEDNIKEMTQKYQKKCQEEKNQLGQRMSNDFNKRISILQNKADQEIMRLQKKITDIADSEETLTTEAMFFKEKMNNKNAEINDLKNQIENLKKTLSSKDVRMKTLGNDAEKCINKVNQIQAALDKEILSQKTSSEQIKKLSSILNDEQKLVKKLQNDIENCNKKGKNLQGEFDKVKSDLNTCNNKGKSMVRHYESTLNTIKDDIKQCQNNFRTCQSKFNECQTSSRNNFGQLNNQINQLTSQVNNLKSQLQQKDNNLQQCLANLQQEQQRNQQQQKNREKQQRRGEQERREQQRQKQQRQEQQRREQQRREQQRREQQRREQQRQEQQRQEQQRQEQQRREQQREQQRPDQHEEELLNLYRDITNNFTRYIRDARNQTNRTNAKKYRKTIVKKFRKLFTANSIPTVSSNDLKEAKQKVNKIKDLLDEPRNQQFQGSEGTSCEAHIGSMGCDEGLCCQNKKCVKNRNPYRNCETMGYTAGKKRNKSKKSRKSNKYKN